jgi:cephalosporin hydroxylase
MKRSFKSFFTSEQIAAYQRGTMQYRYRDIACNKSPIDLALYLRLFQDARPRTLFEIGSKAGGSALLLRDFGRVLDLRLEVISIDIAKPEAKFEGVTFLEGDVHHLGRTFEQHQLDRCPRPWLVIEDSAHTADACTAALDFFAGRLRPGEWLAMEDGVLDELGLKEKYGGGPNQAIAQFLGTHPGVFEIGVEYCDMFGPNATYNPNGYLKRTSGPFHGSEA